MERVGMGRADLPSGPDDKGQEPGSAIYTSSVRVYVLVYVVVLLVTGVLGGLWTIGAWITNAGNESLFAAAVIMLAGFLLAPYMFSVARRDRYEFFNDFVRITRRGKPPHEVPYSDLEAVGKPNTTVLSIKVRGEKRVRWVPIPKTRQGPPLQAWLSRKVSKP